MCKYGTILRPCGLIIESKISVRTIPREHILYVTEQLKVSPVEVTFRSYAAEVIQTSLRPRIPKIIEVKARGLLGQRGIYLREWCRLCAFCVRYQKASLLTYMARSLKVVDPIR